MLAAAILLAVVLFLVDKNQQWKNFFRVVKWSTIGFAFIGIVAAVYWYRAELDFAVPLILFGLFGFFYYAGRQMILAKLSRRIGHERLAELLTSPSSPSEETPLTQALDRRARPSGTP